MSSELVKFDIQTQLTNELGLTVDETGALIESYGLPMEEIGQYINTAQSIEVKSEDDVEQMKLARSTRLKIREGRLAIEGKHRELKEDINKRGGAIDFVKRKSVEFLKPIEEKLMEQEKFAELLQEKRKAELKAQRIEKLLQYTDNISMYNLDDMEEDTFNTLHDQLKDAHDAKVKKAEEEAADAEKARLEKEAEDKRIREENEKLKAEAEAKEAERSAEKEAEEAAAKKAEEDRIAEESRINGLRDHISKITHGVRTLADAIKAKDDLKKYYNSLESVDRKNSVVEAAYSSSLLLIERMERDIENRIEEDRKAKEAEAEAKAKAEAEEKERQELLAPDRDKLIKFNEALAIIRTTKIPAVKTKQAQDVVNLIEEMFVKMEGIIDKKAKEL